MFNMHPDDVAKFEKEIRDKRRKNIIARMQPFFILRLSDRRRALVTNENLDDTKILRLRFLPGYEKMNEDRFHQAVLEQEQELKGGFQDILKYATDEELEEEISRRKAGKNE